MAAWLRRSTYITLGALWLTGCAWLVLHYFFQGSSDFGSAPHPWQPTLMTIHGVLAAVSIFLFGWIAGAHIGEHWRRGLNRTSGLTLVTVFTMLAITGLGSYYLTGEPLRNTSTWIHEAVGALAIAPAIAHWLGNGAAKARKARAA